MTTDARTMGIDKKFEEEKKTAELAAALKETTQREEEEKKQKAQATQPPAFAQRYLENKELERKATSSNESFLELLKKFYPEMKIAFKPIPKPVPFDESKVISPDGEREKNAHYLYYSLNIDGMDLTFRINPTSGRKEFFASTPISDEELKRLAPVMVASAFPKTPTLGMPSKRFDNESEKLQFAKAMKDSYIELAKKDYMKKTGLTDETLIPAAKMEEFEKVANGIKLQNYERPEQTITCGEVILGAKRPKPTPYSTTTP